MLFRSCQLLDEDAVGGHAGISQVGEPAWLVIFSCAGGTQGAAAGANQKAVAPLFTEALHQTDGGGVVAGFSLLDGGGVGIAFQLPDALQHQRLFVGKHLLLHLLP